jgi:signal transduction histidine kinase
MAGPRTLDDAVPAPELGAGALPARLVAAHDAALRRARDELHAGAQQRLTHTVIALKLARAALEVDDPAAALVDEALSNAETASAALRDAQHELLPAVLDRLGLEAAIESLAEQLGPTAALAFEVTVPRLPEPIETTAYRVVAAVLSAATADGDAGRVQVVVRVDEHDAVLVDVRVPGSAHVADGPHLTVLRDRVEAVGGRLTAQAAPETGSVILARLPITPATGP